MPQESAVCISVWSKIKFLRTLCNTNEKMSLIQHMVQYQFFNLKKKIKPKRKKPIVNTCTLPVVLKAEAPQLKKKLGT